MTKTPIISYPEMDSKTGFSNPIFFTVAFFYCTIALNADWSNNSIVWWSSTALFLLTWLLSSGGKLYFDPSYTLWLFSFTAFAGLSYLWAESGEAVFTVMKSLAVRLLILVLLRASIRTMKDLHKLLIVIIGASIINSFYLFVLEFTRGAMEEDDFRLGSANGWNANAVGMMAAFAAVMLLYFFQKNQKKGTKILCIMGIAALVIVSLMSGSRKALIIVLGGTVAYLLLTAKKKKFQTIFLILLFVFLLYYLIMETEFFYSIIGVRMEGFLAMYTGEGEVESSALLREKLISAAIEAWKEHPILGRGLDCFRFFAIKSVGHDYYAHNNYVELMADLGLIGTIIYYSGPVTLLFSLKSKIKKETAGKLFFILIGIVFLMDFACVSYLEFMFSLILLAIYSYISIKNNNEG